MNKLVDIGSDKFKMNCLKCKSTKVSITLFDFHDRSVRMTVECNECSNKLNVILPFYEEKEI